MDSFLLFNLTRANAELCSAMEVTESGGPEWDLICKMVKQIEQLITYEVNDTWPVENNEGDDE